METIKSVIKDLAKTELLNKCPEGYTQNANESLNSIIRKYSPQAYKKSKKNKGQHSCCFGSANV